MSPAAEPVSLIEVDARGLRCPLPVIRLAEAARDAPAGTWIVVLASDPAARHDIPAWCRMRGHGLLEVTELTGETGTNEVTGTNDLAGALSSAGADQEPQVRQPAVLRLVVVIRR